VRERRHRRALSYGEVVYDSASTGRGTNKDSLSSFQMVNGDDNDDELTHIDPRIEKEIEHLSKIPESGTARIILEDLRKKRLLDPLSLDPRSSSRTPSASTEPPYKTRYESSIYACKMFLYISLLT